MALFKNEPRSATIQASEDLWLATVTKESYLRILAGGMVKALQEKLDFMKKLPVLRDMDPYALRNLSLCFQRLSVPRGRAVQVCCFLTKIFCYQM
jgi:CRP-like cAMP-binding protein